MNLFTYLIKCSLALGAFYIIYFVLLRKQNHLVVTRFFLLSTLIFSMILPGINIRIPVENPDAVTVFRLKEVVIGENSCVLESVLNLDMIITLLIGLSSSYFLFRLLKQIWLISRLVRNNRPQKEGTIFIIENDHSGAFSFFKYIFINRYIESTEKQKILLHEKTHVQQWHTIDKLISEVVLALLWFNPFAWLYCNAIAETHEYLADETVLKYGINRLDYQQLLMNQIFGTDRLQFVQYFNQSLTKKRMIMMTKNEYSKPLKLRILIALPLAGMIIAFFAFKASIPEKVAEPVKEVLNALKTTEKVTVKASTPEKVSEPLKKVPNALKTTKKNIIAPKNTSNVFVVVEQNARFQGGDINDFRTYVANNLTYPAKAKKMGIEGKIIVQFVVDYNGNVKNVIVLRSLYPECDEEAIRVIQASPKWEPALIKGVKVNQQLVIPIAFKKTTQ